MIEIKPKLHSNTCFTIHNRLVILGYSLSISKRFW